MVWRSARRRRLQLRQAIQNPSYHARSSRRARAGTWKSGRYTLGARHCSVGDATVFGSASGNLRRPPIPKAQKELLRVVAQPLGIAERLAGADAQEHVVGMRVGFAKVMDVVGADEREPEVAGDCRQAAVDHPLILDPVPLHLEEEVARPQDVAIGAGGLDRLLLLLVRQPLGHLALEAAAQPDEALRVLSQQLLVDARLVVEALGVAC
jgi:hypothetical protein